MEAEPITSSVNITINQLITMNQWRHDSLAAGGWSMCLMNHWCRSDRWG